MTGARDGDLDTALAEVTTRLARRFDALDPDLVAATVRRCAGDFAGVRVGRFVPVFVERRSAAHLAALDRDRRHRGAAPARTSSS